MATHNQIAYAEYKERLRHNVETERETARSNRATERLRYMELSETQRHNLASEHLAERDLEEKIRANMAREQLGWAELSEKQRHNIVMEEVDKVRNIEMNRHNLASEQLGMFQLGESSRHNKVSEYNERLKIKNDLKRIEETIRSNRNNEAIQRDANFIKLKDVYAKIQRYQDQAKRESDQTTTGWVGLIMDGAKLVADVLAKWK